MSKILGLVGVGYLRLELGDFRIGRLRSEKFGQALPTVFESAKDLKRAYVKTSTVIAAK